MRVGLVDINLPGWAGGGGFIQMLSKAMASARGAPDALLFFHDAENARVKAIEGIEYVACERVRRYFPAEVSLRARVPTLDALFAKRPVDLVRRVYARLGGESSPLLELAQHMGVDVLLPLLSPLPGHARLAQIAWIPDFQHRHLPGFFSEAEIASRTADQDTLARSCRRVLLSSADALADYQRFHPGASRGVALPFPSGFAFGPPQGAPEAARARYGIPERFLLVANQFWAHKNHATLLDALALAKAHMPDVAVVMTGLPLDYRSPVNSTVSEVLQQIASRGVRANTWMLGLVARADLDGLMRGATALIQPSRFEGWSTSVQDAKALGIPVICSDLGVHREQAPQAFGFFGCDDAKGLADLMVRALRELPAARRQQDEDVALANARDEGRAYGEAMWRLCREAMETPAH